MGDLRRGLPLAGWSQRSVWGIDSGMAAFFAQLWRDGSDSDEPEIWITPLSSRWPDPIINAVDLARAIAHATGASPDDVANAIMASAPDLLERMTSQAG